MKSPEELSDSASRGSDLDEGCRMEVEEEVQSEKKLGEQRRNLQREMRDIDKLTFMEPAVREAQKEKFMRLLQEVETKSTDLLPEDQKIQQRSQKLQSLQDKKKHHLKEACASEEEMQKLDEEMAKMRARFQALSEKSGESRRAASEVEEEVRISQAGEERRGSCASVSNGCCSEPAML